MENASYHSRIDPATASPTSKTIKSDMIQWLQKKGVAVDPLALKPTVYEMVKQHKPPKDYVVDKLIQEWGHRVLRLPPYHCDLNPIEMIWGITKNNVADNNKTFKLSDAKTLTDTALESIKKETFQKSCRHTEEIEAKYWAQDGLDITPIVNDIVIDLEETDTESEMSVFSDLDSE